MVVASRSRHEWQLTTYPDLDPISFARRRPVRTPNGQRAPILQTSQPLSLSPSPARFTASPILEPQANETGAWFTQRARNLGSTSPTRASRSCSATATARAAARSMRCSAASRSGSWRRRCGRRGERDRRTLRPDGACRVSRPAANSQPPPARTPAARLHRALQPPKAAVCARVPAARTRRSDKRNRRRRDPPPRPPRPAHPPTTTEPPPEPRHEDWRPSGALGNLPEPAGAAP